MRIVLNGVETNNKGAELMLYAILQEIEKKYSNAEVFIPYRNVPQGIEFVDTPLKFRYKPLYILKKIAHKFRLGSILRRLGVYCNWIYDLEAVGKTDYFIDGSGFAFSDQWKLTPTAVTAWKKQLAGYKKQGTKIVFLPQAFGPVSLKETKDIIAVLNKYADVIMPRERVSLKYLEECNVNPSKIALFTDFTSLVHGIIPIKYNHLQGAVCIIPNKRMIDKGTITIENYLKILTGIIHKAQELGKNVYLLNHEGKEDEELAYMCHAELGGNIEVVTGLKGLEVKGLISTSYLCITSRFHGVASALNSCVPCLATSWSHKYEELFKDYGMKDCVLNIADLDICLAKVSEYMDTNYNNIVRQQLTKRLPLIQEQTRRMWNKVWQP